MRAINSLLYLRQQNTLNSQTNPYQKENEMSSKHEPFDETAKVFYRRFFENKGLLVETEREVFFRARKIDLVVTCNESEQNSLDNTIFSHFRSVNSLELKGPNDPLTIKDYNRILMRAWGLGGLEEKEEEETDEESAEEAVAVSDNIKLLPSHRTLTIVCVTKPQKILNTLELNFLKTEPGIYYCQDNQIKIWIICPSELLLVEKNYPLLALARGNKLAEFLSICVRDDLVEYLQLIKDIGLLTDPNLIWQKILEVQNMKPEIKEETWSYIDRFFQEMPEAMTKLPTVQEAVQQSVQKAVQEALQKAAQEAVQKATKEIVAEKKRVLIRLLHRKFASVPNNVVEKIEATDDLEQLDNWLDQIIVAESLAETELVATGKSDK